ncbi:hypothetical protein BB8028_0004g12600 [Beauveria bassiana]|uniref:Coiled-coil domain-containing protein 16 n=1 Tax=Beauveria bassiana TaxID=176275 RepID=A0A2S7YDR5_BEABA|nr:hypothetical protein BB8028_0004g12600 [Beauveria bassiana]
MLRILGCTNPCICGGTDEAPRLCAPRQLFSSPTKSRFRMADVRALLRQQRLSRRINHPHAAYSDAGKLLCTLCREQIRAESHWESHTRSTSHQRRVVAAAAAATTTTTTTTTTNTTTTTTAASAEPAPSEAEEPVTEKLQVTQTHDATVTQGPEEQEHVAEDEDEDEKKNTMSTANDGTETRTQSHKRKISDEDDDVDAMDLDEAARRKRSRGDISIDVSAANHRRDSSSAASKDKDAGTTTTNSPARRDSNRTTPPTLARRMSSTPSRGVELRIPSRPATPAHRESSSSTPGGGLPTLTGLSAVTPSSAATNGSAIAAEKLPRGGGSSSNSDVVGAQGVDEDEWAAFEAEMAAATAPYADDAVISAPAMDAETSAAAAAAAAAKDLANGGDGSATRKSRADLDIEGEREDAARAREDEFNDMQELEARVRRLKEKREELRKRASSVGQNNDGPARLQSQLPEGGSGKSPAAEEGAEKNAEEDEDGEDDDDDDDDDDDWDGFRFRK